MQAELLEAIRAAPDDDGPRLVYGDFLLSNGDPRGELIQVQCRLADPAITPSEHRRLRAVENKLLAAHGAAWNAPVFAAIGYGPGIDSTTFATVKVELRRGFVDSVRAPAEVLDRLDALFAAAPLITKLRLDAQAPFDQPTLLKPGILDSPHLAGLERLEVLLPGNGDEGAAQIASCPHLARLRELSLSLSRWAIPGEPETRPPEEQIFGAAGARALASSPYLGNVRSLVLDNNRLEAAGVTAIVGSTRWKLEELSFANNLLDAAAIAAIADAPALASLTTLSLTGNPLSAAAVTSLARSKHLGALASLDLERCAIGPKGIRALLDGMGLERLVSLNISHDDLGDEGANVVAASPKTRQLRVLDIAKNQIGKKGLATLARSEHFAGLEKLLVFDRESKEARDAFLSSKALANTQIYFRGKLLSRASKEAKREEVEAAPPKKTRAKPKPKPKINA